MADTAARLLTLLSLLQARRDWPGEALAERLQVSPRTVRRDIDRLRELGYPVRAMKGPDGGYRLDAGSELPPLLFDDGQAVAVAIALQTTSSTVTGVAEDSVRALATVRQVMPARLRARIDALEVTMVDSRSRNSPKASTKDLLAIGTAIKAREILRFDYEYPRTRRRDSAGLTTKDAAGPLVRKVEPHHLVTWEGRWYVIAWDLDRCDWRTFRVDRMTPRIPTGPRFARRELPGDDVATFLAQRFSSIPGSVGVAGEAIMSAPASEIAQWIGRTGIVEALSEGTSRVHLTSWSWTGLAANLAAFNVPFEVAGPPELVAALASLGQRCQNAVGAALAEG